MSYSKAHTLLSTCRVSEAPPGALTSSPDSLPPSLPPLHLHPLSGGGLYVTGPSFTPVLPVTLILLVPASSSDPHLLCGPRARLGTLSAEGWIVNRSLLTLLQQFDSANMGWKELQTVCEWMDEDPYKSILWAGVCPQEFWGWVLWQIHISFCSIWS